MIHSATQEGARPLGHEDQVGTIRVGRNADLVMVKGDPLALVPKTTGEEGRSR